jgi:hypothetical protein
VEPKGCSAVTSTSSSQDAVSRLPAELSDDPICSCDRLLGDLTVIIKDANYQSVPGSFRVEKDNKIVNTHQSIHKSPKIPENVLKLTVKTEDDSKTEAFNYTKAIKQNNKIGFLHARRCQSLLDERYIYRGKAEKLFSLGSCEFRQYQMIYTVGVASADFHFELYGHVDFSYKTKIVGEFKIIILWTFFIQPSNSTGNFLIGRTEPSTSANSDDILNKMMQDGFSEFEFTEFFDWNRHHLRDDYFNATQNDVPDLPDDVIPELRMFASRFFANTHDSNMLIVDHKRRIKLYLDMLDWKN